MEELRKVLEAFLNKELLFVVISAPKSKTGPDKVKVRPILIKEELKFQTAISDGKKEIHKNYGQADIKEELLRWMESEFKQLQLESQTTIVTVLISKKGKVTVKKKQRSEKKEGVALAHNRKKEYLLEEGIPVPFLVELGVMTPEGKVVKSKYDKFRQINRFLEFIRDIMDQLPREREIKILDFGCGKSYLTFAMYYYLKILNHLDVQMIGLDLKEDVITHCNQLAGKFGYEKLTFLAGDIADYDGTSQVDMVVTLHACDTATDFALKKAVDWQAKVILSVPCCQHEINGQLSTDRMQPVLKYGLIKERMAALLTDSFRGGILEQKGYQVQILEFIDMEHTPKNILIRGVKTGTGNADKQVQECMEFWGVSPTLEKLFGEEVEQND